MLVRWTKAAMGLSVLAILACGGDGEGGSRNPDASGGASGTDLVLDGSSTGDAGTVDAPTPDASADAAVDGGVGDAMSSDAAADGPNVVSTGELELVPAPPSVVPNVNEHPSNILVFAEQQGVTLTNPVPFDVHIPGLYNATPDNQGDVPAGVTVDVFFLHFDPEGTGTVNRTGTLVFPNDILALITATSTLEATDGVLGLPGQVVYPTPGTHNDRGLEDGNQDPITLHGDRRQLDIDFRTSTSSDQIRIITLSTSQAMPLMHSRNVVVIDPPASVVLGASEDASRGQLFDERQGVTLAAPLTVNAMAAGEYRNQAAMQMGEIAAGTRVDSALIHIDPPGSLNQTMTIAFLRPIVGVAVTSATLQASDAVVGLPGTTYPVDPDRQLELGTDWFDLAADGRSIRLRASANTGTDQMRVIFASP